MSLLTLVQDAATLVGIEAPSAVASATDVTTAQLRVLAQQEGDELSRAFDWRRLKVQATITGDGTTEYWDLPDDFDRQMAGDNLWLTSAPLIPLSGPVSDEEMLAMKSAPARPIRPIWRYFGDQLQIWPYLTSMQSCSLEYRSSHWISSSDGDTVRARWQADTDYALVPERIMTLGLIWRWKRAKGLDYAEEFNTYQMERTKAERADGGFRTLHAKEIFTRDSLTGRKNMYSVVIAP